MSNIEGKREGIINFSLGLAKYEWGHWQYLTRCDLEWKILPEYEWGHYLTICDLQWTILSEYKWWHLHYLAICDLEWKILPEYEWIFDLE